MLRTNSGNEKPHLSWIETDLCKSVHWAPTPTSLCPGTPVTCFDKACWNKLSLARQRWACHPPAASPAAAGMALRAAGDAVPLRCGNPPMPTKKGVSRVFVSVTESTASPQWAPECVRIQIQFISAYISTWAPQSEPDLCRSPKLKCSRWLHGKMLCCLARMTFSANAAKTTALPVSKSLHQSKETPNPFGHGCKPLQWDILRYKQVTVTCLCVRRSVWSFSQDKFWMFSGFRSACLHTCFTYIPLGHRALLIDWRRGGRHEPRTQMLPVKKQPHYGK